MTTPLELVQEIEEVAAGIGSWRHADPRAQLVEVERLARLAFHMLESEQAVSRLVEGK